MSRFELQILEIERRNNRLMGETGQVDTEILYSIMADSYLHQVIHNPVTEGIDQG